MASLVAIVERSHDAKLTSNKNVSATWVPQQSCHDDCRLKKNGCYAELGNCGIHTHRMNKQAKALKLALNKLRLKLAKEEAYGIRNLLSGTRKLRVHVVGDCATRETARIVGRAMRDYVKRFGKPAWTYTHSWRRILAKEWMGASVLASCERPEEVAQAQARGYAAVLITPYHQTNKVYSYKGLNILPCPAQFKYKHGQLMPPGALGERRVTCETCNICMNPAMLRARNLVVGFQPDHTLTAKKVIALTEG